MNPTPDADLLRLLRSATRHLDREEICGQLYWGPTQLTDRIQALRQCGYTIEEHPHLGIKLLAAPNRLIADDLFTGSARIGSRILVFEETASTNDMAAKFGKEGAPDGLVLIAEKQTGGRGRLGRRWESQANQGIYLSLLLRPQFERQYWANLTTWAAVMVAKTIEEIIGCSAKIKWPNDIYLEGKKAVGILSESHTDKQGRPFAIVGIGINVNQTEFPADLAEKATSLRISADRVIDRREIVIRLLEQLEASYDLLDYSFLKIIQEADQRSYLKGQWVRLQAGTTIIEGIAGTLDETGALRILQDGGGFISVASGEVTVTGIAKARSSP